MTAQRKGKTFNGSHEYKSGQYLITLMANGKWMIFDARGCENGAAIGGYFDTLTAARKWLKTNCK